MNFKINAILLTLILVLIKIIILLKINNKKKIDEQFEVYESDMCKDSKNFQCPYPPPPVYDSYF